MVLKSLAVATSVVALADQPTQTINENNVRGTRDVTALTVRIPPKPCSDPRFLVDAVGYGACLEERFRAFAKSVRQHLGDPGKH